jgi:plastocyanin
MKRFGTLFLIVTLATFLIAGCDRYKKKGEGEGAADAGSASKTPYASKGDEGTISGVIKFDGTPPNPKRIDMSADANCAAGGGGAMTDDVLVDNGKLENVFVYVKGGPVDSFSFEPPSDPVLLDQLGCRYHPRVLGIQTGQTLKVTNSDATTHNVHPTPKNNPEWNQSQSAGGAPIEKKFNRAETLIPIKCNVHPWMKANVGVLGHPLFAVSAKDGSYSIKNVPPGSYTLVAWHETFGEKSQNITVGAKESKTQDFAYGANQAYVPTSLKVEPALVLP